LERQEILKASTSGGHCDHLFPPRSHAQGKPLERHAEASLLKMKRSEALMKTE